MNCPKCQFENPELASFCVECEERLENNCPECGFNNEPTFKLCAKCGDALAEQKKSPPVDYYDHSQSYTPKFLADKILTTRSSVEGERKLVSTVLLPTSYEKGAKGFKDSRIQLLVFL